MHLNICSRRKKQRTFSGQTNCGWLRVNLTITREGEHPLFTLNAPIATKVVCFSGQLKCLRSLYGKQCRPRSDCSCRSSLFWVHPVSFYTSFVSKVRQLFAADDFSRRHFQIDVFLALKRVINPTSSCSQRI